MARKKRSSPAKPDATLVDAALAAMSADELRERVRYTLLGLDDRAYGRVLNRLLDRAARTSGWTPDGPSAEAVASAASFAKAAERVGHADPREVDDHLCARRGLTHAAAGPAGRAARRVARCR